MREAMVGHLRHIDQGLAERVAEGLGLEELPEGPGRPAADHRPARRRRASSIVANGPAAFAGRKLGVLVTDGADAAKLVDLVRQAAEAAHVNVELVGASVGGVKDGDGNVVPVDQKIEGAPSVLYDAVVVLTATQSARPRSPATRRPGTSSSTPSPTASSSATRPGR